VSISVVIPFKNALPHFEPCAESMVNAVAFHGATEVIFVDNGSTDGSRHVAEAFAERCRGRVLSLPDAKVGGLRNYGAANSGGEILSFIDSDCVVPEDYFVQVAKALCENPSSAVGSRYRLPEEAHWLEAAWDSLHVVRPGGTVKHINAGNFACFRTAFEAVGGFDPDLASGEDAELCARLVAHGTALVETPEVEATHLGNPKSVRAFVVKQRWHGRGMFGSMRVHTLDLPVIATFMYLGGIVLTPFLILKYHLWGAVVGVLLTQAVPLATVGHRVRSNRVRVRWLRALLLYNLYFTARILALSDIMLGRDRAGSEVR
jgi:glycosyltransferase involved in cell wall biosynthesis